jgi:hypothetical protein
LSKRIGLSLLALLIVLGGNAFGAIVYPGVPTPSSIASATNWSFELGVEGGAPNMWLSTGTFVNPSGGSFSQPGDTTPGSLAYARIFGGNGIAAYISTGALAGAIYGATAAIARNSADASWTLQLFQGGTLTLTPGTPGGSTLLASTSSSSAPAAGSPGAPNWNNFGVSESTGATGGSSIWVRILANAGEVGADAVLGVETAADGGGGGAIPEPFTMGLVGSGFLGLALYRRNRK